MEKFYRISVLKKKNGWAYYFIDLTANNSKEAKEKAKEIWERDFMGIHPFHITVKLLKDNVLSEGCFSRRDEYF